VVDAETGEVLVETNQEITATLLAQIMGRRVAPFKLLAWCRARPDGSLYETLSRDHFKNPDEALVEIYRRLRPGDRPPWIGARAVPRHVHRPAPLRPGPRGPLHDQQEARPSGPTSTSRPSAARTWSTWSAPVPGQSSGASRPTDIDHLGNRRVRSVGELLENQFRWA